MACLRVVERWLLYAFAEEGCCSSDVHVQTHNHHFHSIEMQVRHVHEAEISVTRVMYNE
jgi:hypothetical protein